MTTISPYLRRPSVPRPDWFVGDAVQTAIGVGTVVLVYRDPELPHWRYRVRLSDGTFIKCCADGVRSVILEYAQAAE